MEWGVILQSTAWAHCRNVGIATSCCIINVVLQADKLLMTLRHLQRRVPRMQFVFLARLISRASPTVDSRGLLTSMLRWAWLPCLTNIIIVTKYTWFISQWCHAGVFVFAGMKQWVNVIYKQVVIKYSLVVYFFHELFTKLAYYVLHFLKICVSVCLSSILDYHFSAEFCVARLDTFCSVLHIWCIAECILNVNSWSHRATRALLAFTHANRVMLSI